MVVKKNIHESPKREEGLYPSVEKEKSEYHNVFKHFIENLPLNDLIYISLMRLSLMKNKLQKLTSKDVKSS